MRSITIVIILSVLTNPTFAQGEKTKKIDPTLENISGMYAECAAYFSIAYNALISSGKADDTAAQYATMQESAVSTALFLAAQGRTLEMAHKVTKSRIQMYQQKMKKDIEDSYANISILFNKYTFLCKEALENPEKFIGKLKDK